MRARRAGGHGCPGLASTQRSTSHTRQPSATPSSLPTAPAACAVPRAPATCVIRSLRGRIQSSNGRIQNLTVKTRKLLDRSTLSYQYCLSQWRRINRLLNSICELNSRDYGWYNLFLERLLFERLRKYSTTNKSQETSSSKLLYCVFSFTFLILK